MNKQSINDFVLLTQIGKGAYAKVFLSRHKNDNKL